MALKPPRTSRYHIYPPQSKGPKDGISPVLKYLSIAKCSFSVHWISALTPSQICSLLPFYVFKYSFYEDITLVMSFSVSNCVINHLLNVNVLLGVRCGDAQQVLLSLNHLLIHDAQYKSNRSFIFIYINHPSTVINASLPINIVFN